jgi:hypothetical protein
MKHGHGTLTFPDGAQFIGEWKDDKASGDGLLILPDGQKIVGEYRDGKFVEGGYVDE